MSDYFKKKPLINKDRSEKNSNARELGMTNKAYKKQAKKAQKIILKAKKNFVELRDIYERTSTKILLDNEISVDRLDAFFNEGGLVCQYFINHDSEIASDLEDKFDIAISELGIDHSELNSIIMVQFFPIKDDEKVEELPDYDKTKSNVVEADEIMNSIQETIERIEG